MDWKKRIAENIPEAQADIDARGSNVMSVWMGIRNLLDRAVERNSSELICRIAKEFRYFLDYEGENYDEYYTAVIYGLLQDFVSINGIEEYTNLFLSRDEFLEFREALTNSGKSKLYFRVLEKAFS